MKIEIEDWFEEGLGLWLSRALMVFAAVWAGSVIAAVCLLAGKLGYNRYLEPVDYEEFAGSLYLLIGPWLLPNAMLLGLVCCVLVLSPGAAGLRVWGGIIAGEAFFAMIEGSERLGTRTMAIVLSWVALLVVLSMAGAGFRFLGQWRTNRWVRELVTLEIENRALALERAEEEEEISNEANPSKTEVEDISRYAPPPSTPETESGSPRRKRLPRIDDQDLTPL